MSNFFDPFNIEEVIEGFETEGTDLLSPLMIPQHDAKRIHTKGFRFYYHTDDPQGKGGLSDFFPSATTITKFLPSTETDGLKRWVGQVGNAEASRHMNDRRDFGTIQHILLAQYLKRVALVGKDQAVIFQAEVAEAMRLFASGVRRGDAWVRDNMLEMMKDLLSYRFFVEAYNFRPLLIEKTLFNSKKGYAATLDLAGIIDHGPRFGPTAKTPYGLKKPDEATEAIALLDAKSGKQSSIYTSHIVQLLLILEAFQENFPGHDVGFLARISPKDWRSKPDFRLFEIDPKTTKWAGRIDNLIATAKADLGGVDDWKHMTTLEAAIAEDIDNADMALDWSGLDINIKTVREAVEAYEAGVRSAIMTDEQQAGMNADVFLDESFKTRF